MYIDGGATVRPSIAESVQSANSSGHLFPVDIRASQAMFESLGFAVSTLAGRFGPLQDKDKQSPTPRTGQTTNIFEVLGENRNALRCFMAQVLQRVVL